jgi:nucleolar protein 12
MDQELQDIFKSTEHSTNTRKQTGKVFLKELEQFSKKQKGTKQPIKSSVPNTIDPFVASKTLFVSNVPIECLTDNQHLKELKKFFSTIGPISRIRFRSIAFDTPTKKRKDAFISKEHFHPDRKTSNAYIVYSNPEHVSQALKLNGSVFMGKHLRVDRCDESKNRMNKKRTIFIGNLVFDIEDEELWAHFHVCGEIENVRVIRDKETNFGKGFGYVEFKSIDGYHASLAMNGKELRGRKLRISKYSGMPQKHTRSSVP